MSGSIGEPGPLTQVVHSYERVMRELAPRVRAPSDWAPLAELVAVDDFERIGTFLETQNWEQYTVMLTRWGLVDRLVRDQRAADLRVAEPRLLRVRGAPPPR